jgi:hypothetical protein
MFFKAVVRRLTRVLYVSPPISSMVYHRPS